MRQGVRGLKKQCSTRRRTTREETSSKTTGILKTRLLMLRKL